MSGAGSITDLWGSNQDFSGGSGSTSNFGAGLGAAGSLIGGIGSLIGAQGQAAADTGVAKADLASAQGYEAEAAAYGQAAGYAAGNVNLAQESTLIQQYQQQRELALTVGKQQAGVAGAGFQASGSSFDLLRASMAQGALAKGLIGVQGDILSQGYAAQEAAFLGEQQQANAASEAAKASAAAAEQQAKSAQSSGFLGALGSVFGAAAQALPLLMVPP